MVKQMQWLGYQKIWSLELTTSGLVSSGWTDGHGLVTLLAKFFSSQRQLVFGEIVDFQTLDNGPLLVSQGDGEAEHDTLGSSVAAIGKHSHANKLTCQDQIDVLD